MQLSEVNPRPEDLISSVEMSCNPDELEALLKSTREQLLVLRGKDSGGDQGSFLTWAQLAIRNITRDRGESRSVWLFQFHLIED